MEPIYLDHNATTRPLPEVVAAMREALDTGFGNPSSVHGFGRQARQRAEGARRQVAALVGAQAEEIVFTSGGTESDNLGILPVARAVRAARGRGVLVTSPVEHPAVTACMERLATEGFVIRVVPVDGQGRLDEEAAARALTDEVALCSFALANHEIGNLYPVAALAGIAHRVGALMHCDAVQAAGKVRIDVGALGVDLLSLSAHKLHGPQGAGALFVRRGLDLAPIFVGGHQERERRPGTENVPALVGFGVAAAQVSRNIDEAAARVAALRDGLEQAALAIPGARRFGGGERVAGTASLGFAGVDGQLLMMALDLEGVAISTGAACTSGVNAPSPVIRALGVSDEVARTAARFSLGRDNTAEEIARVASLLPRLVERIRAAG